MTREELNQKKQQEIFDEERYVKRKKITIFIFKLAFFIIAVFLLFYLYVTFVSSKILSVNEHRIINNKLPDSFNGLKIVHFSDLHYGTTIFGNDLEKLVNEINDRNPELVVFTGDLIDKNYSLTTNEQEKIISLLKQINATLGKYAVYGEEDDDVFLTIMKQSDFEVLDNSTDLIYNDNSSPILLVGVSSFLKEKSDLKTAFNYYTEPTHNSNIFSILLCHEPDFADNIINNYPVNLILAGHSHNGTIRIPFVGGVHKKDGAQKYDDDYYKINSTDLFVSGGIGTNGPGFRLFCRPSFNFFRISVK